MPSKETLKLPTIDVARTREEKVRDWIPPIPLFDQRDFKQNNPVGERKRPFRISLRPKYDHSYTSGSADSENLETKSLPPLLTSGKPERSVSIRRDGKGNFVVGNSYPVANANQERQRPLSPSGGQYPIRVEIETKRTPLSSLGNMVKPPPTSTDSSVTSSLEHSREWNQSLSRGTESKKMVKPRYMSEPFKSQGTGAHLRGQAPLRPEQVLVPSRRHEGCLVGGDGDNDWEWENLYNSITLPRIEAVLRSEGIKPKSISEQIEKIKERCRRQSEYSIPPEAKPKVRPKPRETLKPISRSYEKVSLDAVIASTTKSMSDFLGDIEQTRWLSYQSIERGQFGAEFYPPRIVLLSSNVPGSVELLDKVVRKADDIITICYDFNTATYEKLIDEMKKRLDNYKMGCRARSVLLFCQGGPGYLYMLRKRVVTPQKVVKGEQSDLLMFWREIGEMMSRLRPEEAYFHIMGCDLANKPGNQVLFKELKKLTEPNTVHFEAIIPDTKKGRKSMGSYLDPDQYDGWQRRDTPGSSDSESDTDAAIFAVSSHNAPAQAAPAAPSKSHSLKMKGTLDSIGEQEGDTESPVKPDPAENNR